MRLLTADAGDRPDDFAHTVPGEIVYLGVVCARDDPESIGDGSCGCGRSFAGVGTGMPTTVAVVADLDLTVDDLSAMLADRFTRSGWADPADLAPDAAAEILELAEPFEVGTRLRRWLDEVIVE